MAVLLLLGMWKWSILVPLPPLPLPLPLPFCSTNTSSYPILQNGSGQSLPHPYLLLNLIFNSFLLAVLHLFHFLFESKWNPVE